MKKENPRLRELICKLKKASIEQNVKLWRRIARDLEKPTRNFRVVNLSRINKYTKENEVVVVPGKVLGSGKLEHKLTISAFNFSNSAIEKINKVGAKIVPLEKLIKENPKGKAIKIIG